MGLESCGPLVNKDRPFSSLPYPVKWTIRKSNVSTPSRYCWALALAFFFTSLRIFADTSSDLATIIARLQEVVSYTSGTETAVDRVHQDYIGSNGAKHYLTAISSSTDASADYLDNIDSNIYKIEQLVRALEIPDYSSRLQTINTLLDSFYSRNHTDLQQVNTKLTNLTGVESAAANTSSQQLDRLIRVSLQNKDILAGNPWWATNSQFTSWNASFNDVFPQDPSPTSNYQQSFPEAFSGFLAQLYPYTANRMVSRTGWVDQWGWSRQLNTQLSRGRSYTWFDWMADATRSNWTERASWRSYVNQVDVSGLAASNSIASDISYQQYQDTHAVNEAEDDMRSETEPETPDYTVATVSDDPDADKDNLLDALEEDVQHDTRLVLINGTDFKDATGVDGEMVFNLAEGRFSTFVSDMSTISRAGWYALLAVMSATLFWRKQNEISAIVKGTNFSRV